MATLVVRNVEATVVKALKARAGKRGTSAEAEHRAILRDALLGARKKQTFVEFLLSMPDVGDAEIFKRHQG
jgi:plasmid stability protein